MPQQGLGMFMQKSVENVQEGYISVTGGLV